MDKNSKIVVVGLGYVGLPLAVALARTFPVIWFDIDAGRVAELEAGEDRTRELSRMLAGLADSEAAVAHADELLELAHRASRA